MLTRVMGLALGLAAFSGAADARDDVFWKTVGNWDIAIDTTNGNGCFAYGSWTGGTQIYIGRDPQRDNFYVLLGNSAWAQVEPGNDYEFQIKFGRNPIWDVTSVGVQRVPGGAVFFRTQSRKQDFIREFQRSINMKILYNGREVDNLDLTGSRRAWDNVEECQRQVAQGGFDLGPFTSAPPQTPPPQTTSTGRKTPDPGLGGGSATPSAPGRKTVDPFAN